MDLALRAGSLRAVLAVVVALGGFVVAGWLPAAARAAAHSSANVAVINGSGAGDGGTLPESGSVDGSPDDSFDQFTFSDLDTSQIDPATLSQFDTVVLNQVFTSDLSASQQQILAGFVTGGGKLVILDADGTTGNDYSWLPVPAGTGTSCQNCGNLDGSLQIVENSALISADPSAGSYIDVSELPGNTDAAGDANILVATDPRWDVAMRVSNDNNVSGATLAYATDNGLVIYDGMDTDDFGTDGPSGNDWLSKLYYQELALPWDPDGLPHSVSIVGGGGGPVAQCARRALVVGVVGICADSISDTGDGLQATGNVTLDGGVSVGDGPLIIDQANQTISAQAPVPISILRAGGALSLGSDGFTIDAAATTDSVSGTVNVAKLTLTGGGLSGLGALSAGGLPVELPDGDGVSLYLDAQHGGGLIGAGSLSLPVLKLSPQGSLSVGLYAGTAHAVTPLGGAVKLGKLDLGPGWSFDGLELSYQSASDTWTASGGMTAPIGSLEASGSVIGGRLDSIGASIGGQEVPVGDSGFFLTDFGGQVSGLAQGPLSLSASTGGFWGVPKAPVEPFYLKDVTLTINFAGSVSLDGEVSFVVDDPHSPITGRLNLTLALAPAFKASGTVTASGHLPSLSFDATDRAAFTARHFTAEGSGSLDINLLRGTGREVLSDAGVGASGTLCSRRVFGVGYCQSLAFAATWTQLDKLAHLHASVLGDIIGADPQRLVTVAAAASGTPIRVPPGRTMLLISAIGRKGVPALRITAPDGRRYATDSRRGRIVFGTQPQFHLTQVLVARPRSGVWRVAVAGRAAGPVTVHATTMRPVRLIAAARVTPAAVHRRTRRASVRLRWTSRGLPRGVRVSVLVGPRPGPTSASRRVGAGLRGTGRLAVKVARLTRGRNYFTLVATIRGVTFQRVAFPGSADVVR